MTDVNRLALVIRDNSTQRWMEVRRGGNCFSGFPDILNYGGPYVTDVLAKAAAYLGVLSPEYKPLSLPRPKPGYGFTVLIKHIIAETVGALPTGLYLDQLLGGSQMGTSQMRALIDFHECEEQTVIIFEAGYNGVRFNSSGDNVAVALMLESAALMFSNKFAVPMAIPL